MSKNKNYTLGHALIDLLLFCCTGGLWLIWIIIRELRRINK